MTDTVRLEPLIARTLAVLADCHIHPARGLAWNGPMMEALKGVDHDGRLVVNPGSLTVPVGGDKGAAGSFAKLTIDGARVSAEIVFVGKEAPPATPG